ncbi:MAG: DNA methyltransferase, partial [Armatimonadota bacterium]|nr:DNA methyltransferase [Armatimonadota bacterium]
MSELHYVRSTGTGVKETSYYPALSNLLNTIGKTLKPTVRCIINLKNQGAGIPDGGFFTPDQLRDAADETPQPALTPARGVLEVKGAGDDIRKIAASDQVAKYWTRYGQVLVTNLRDFVLVGRDAAG